MTLFSHDDFDTFFREYAPNVEGFYDALYWTLSDELIRSLMRQKLAIEPGSRVVDAGGGTGRWACWYAQEFGARVTVADLSSDMLSEAERVIAEAGLTDRIDVVQCDLHDAPELADGSFDYVVSTYGVLSFLHDPDAAYRTFARILRPGGQGMVMSHSLANALASKINRTGASSEELRELLRTRIVKWADHVPPLRVFSSRDLASHAEAAGLDVRGVFGVACLASPGDEDFGYPYDRLSTISQNLADSGWFRTVLELELAAAEEPAWADRGTNLMQWFARPA